MPEPHDPQMTRAADSADSALTAALTPGPGDTPGGDPGGAPVLHGRAGRFELFGEIARGGMGAVLRGRDPDLNRELAVKVLLENFRDRPEMARRFVREAQVGGGLQHPGVVPVYELGRFEDQRPFFAMKLIEGRTLSALLHERPSPAHDLPRFLKVFEQVCQTVAYAHSRGVIHRDLKPLNVMVGAFGEMQVMDWGLAKVLGAAADPAEGGAAEPVAAEDGSHTLAGQVLGTPAYMPPEQARGEDVDGRADVFGLGAILCEILTGRPPYSGPAAGAFDKARGGDLAEAFGRLDACGADADLLKLAKACLAPDREARPANGRAVAGAMAAYLAGVQERLKAAEIERAAAQARAAEERKRRRAQLALAASLLCLLAGGAAAGFWVQHQRAERQAELARRGAETERGVEEALREAGALREQARESPDDPARSFGPLAAALSAARRGEELMAGGPCRDELREGVRRLREELDADEVDRQALALLDEARLQQSEERAGRFTVEWAVPYFEAAFRKVGIDLAEQPADEVVTRIRARAIRGRLESALDEWARLARSARERQRLLELAARADPQADSFRNRWRQAVLARDRGALRSLRHEGEAARLPAAALVLFADSLVGVGAVDDAVAVLRDGQERFPGDFWVNHELARDLTRLRPPRVAEAVQYHTVALAVRPRSAGALLNLSAALLDAGQPEQAAAACRRALAIDPGYATAYANLARALEKLGRRDEADAAHRRVADLAPGAGMSDAQRAWLFLERHEAAKAVPVLRRLLEKEPEHAPNLYSLGVALEQAGQPKEAEEAYRKAIEADPAYAWAQNNLGYLLFLQGRRPDAIVLLRRAIESQPDYVLAHLNLGYALYFDGRREDTLAEFRRVVELDPDNVKAHSNIGGLLQLLGRKKDAIAACRKAVELNPGLPEAHLNLGAALLDDDRDEAIRCFRQALALQPDHALAHCNLGQALRYQKKFAEALAELKRGNELAKDVKPWPHPSQRWQAEVEKLVALDDKLSAVRRGGAAPRDADELLELAAFCRAQDRGPRSAARFYEQAFAARPALATDLAGKHGQEAARAAARVGCGDSPDADPFDEAARARWRGRALDWLRANLAAVEKLAADQPKSGPDLARVLARWQKDADLAGLRDDEGLRRLPESERDAWRAFWATVEAARGQVAGPPAK